MRKLPIAKPYFNDCEKQHILKPLETGWVVQGPFVAQFEKLFADFVGAKYAIATTSCTTALHLSLVALGISHGDKVVVPSFTFVASANAVKYTGAEVVFCDIQLNTFNMDVDSLENLIEQDSRIRAIMPVNLFGLCADLPRISEIARKFGLIVIEDSACGFGAYIFDKHSGTFGNAGCFSFHPRKVITTGEGGMMITNDDALAEKVRILRDHGASKSDLDRHVKPWGFLLPEYNLLGYNYRMTDIQGAIGVCQLQKASEILEKRCRLALLYTEMLSGCEFLLPPSFPEGYKHAYQSYVCLFTDGEDLSKLNYNRVNQIHLKRNEFMSRLEALGISTRQGTHAVHTLGYYRNQYGLKEWDFPNSYIADRLSIALPLYYEMTEDDVEYVVSTLKKVYGEMHLCPK
jgi:dTDP-4-amino-4,6-dideoxygalactose transaminase